MTEEFREETPSESGADREAVGHPGIEGVLASLDQLDDLPVTEHVAVFEAAHERLRGALTDAGDDTGRP